MLVSRLGDRCAYLRLSVLHLSLTPGPPLWTRFPSPCPPAFTRRGQPELLSKFFLYAMILSVCHVGWLLMHMYSGLRVYQRPVFFMPVIILLSCTKVTSQPVQGIFSSSPTYLPTCKYIVCQLCITASAHDSSIEGARHLDSAGAKQQCEHGVRQDCICSLLQ